MLLSRFLTNLILVQSVIRIVTWKLLRRVYWRGWKDPNTKRFKRTLIYFNTDTQYANFRVSPHYQATKRHNRFKEGEKSRQTWSIETIRLIRDGNGQSNVCVCDMTRKKRRGVCVSLLCSRDHIPCLCVFSLCFAWLSERDRTTPCMSWFF